MVEKILVAVAWPYASSKIHVGNLAGAYLPADIFARYHRLAGNRVIMVSGSDSHGTPITVRADQDGRSAEEVYQTFHAEFLDLFQKCGLTYDLFTSTHTQNHFKVSQSLFLALLENDLLYHEVQLQWYSNAQARFLPDRYVEGTCYICGYDNARGDQCDNCGNVLDATQLIKPRSKIDQTVPELRQTEHFFFDLAKLEKPVIDFLEARQEYWRTNVIRQSLGWIKSEGLRGSPITRDLDWGIPLPIEGWAGKCLYVWFEAVIGYLSASVEWAFLNDQPDAWRDWWYDGQARAYYFIGKDNIPFHAIRWPAQLIGAGEKFATIFEGQEGRRLTLPYDVPANEFMNLAGRKISGSRNWVVDGLDFLERYDPDALRYYLASNMPEARDSDWDWREFVARNNNELVATWGNLANRTLSLAHRHWDGCVPAPAGDPRSQDDALLETIESGFSRVGDLISAVKLRAALQEVVSLATEVNKYLDRQAPWFEIKADQNAAARTIFTALTAIDSLKILFAPFLPFTSERLHRQLGHTTALFGRQVVEQIQDTLGEHLVLRYNPEGAAGRWQPGWLPAGQRLGPIEPLFKKLEESIAEQEIQRMGGSPV